MTSKARILDVSATGWSTIAGVSVVVALGAAIRLGEVMGPAEYRDIVPAVILGAATVLAGTAFYIRQYLRAEDHALEESVLSDETAADRFEMAYREEFDALVAELQKVRNGVIRHARASRLAHEKNCSPDIIVAVSMILGQKYGGPGGHVPKERAIQDGLDGSVD